MHALWLFVCVRVHGSCLHVCGRLRWPAYFGCGHAPLGRTPPSHTSHAVGLCDQEGKTALWWASSRGLKEAVEALLAAGADHGVLDKVGASWCMSLVAREGVCVSGGFASGDSSSNLAQT